MIRQLLNILKITFFIIIPLTSFSQASIIGTVKNIQNKQPLNGANVYLMDLNKGVMTNMKGEFVFKNIPFGEHMIIVKYAGYKKFQKSINVQDSIFKMVIPLRKDTLMLKPTTISSERIIIPFTISKTTVMQSELQESSVRDIGDYLRNMPNIGGVRKGGSSIDPVIRGFRFFQVNVRMDGGIMIPGGCPNRMDPTTSHVENEDIVKVEIINGPYALKYGPSFGGYVNLITTKPTPFPTKKWEAKAKAVLGYESNWNGYKQYYNLKTGNNKVYFNFTLGQRDYGNYKDGNGDVVVSKIFKYSYSAEAGMKLSKKHSLLFSYKGSFGRNVAYPALRMDERSDDTHVIYAQYMGKNLTKRIKGVKIRAFRSHVLHIMDNGEKSFSDTTFTLSEVDATVYGVGGGMMIKAGKMAMLSLKLSFGTGYKVGERTKTMLGQYPINGIIPVKKERLMDSRMSNLGFSAEYSKKWKQYKFVAAARIDYNMATSQPMFGEDLNGDTAYFNEDTDTNLLNFSANIGINRKLGKKWLLGFAMGRGVRSPSMLERYVILMPIGFDNFDYIGNPSLSPEINNQVDLSVQYKAKFGTFRLNGFYSYIQNYISAKVVPPSQMLPNSEDVLGVKKFYNVDYALFRGFEFTYATPEHKSFLAQFMAAYTYATNPTAAGYISDANGTPIGDVIVEDDAIPEIPPFEASVMLNYRFLDNKAKAGVMVRWVADQNYVSEAWNEKPTPGFTLVNLNATYVLNKHLTTTAGVNNLFDLAYYEHLNRRIIGSSLNLMEPGRVFYINLIFKI